MGSFAKRDVLVILKQEIISKVMCEIPFLGGNEIKVPLVLRNISKKSIGLLFYTNVGK